MAVAEAGPAVVGGQPADFRFLGRVTGSDLDSSPSLLLLLLLLLYTDFRFLGRVKGIHSGSSPSLPLLLLLLLLLQLQLSELSRE